MRRRQTVAGVLAGFAAGIAFIVACSSRPAGTRPGLDRDGGVRDGRVRDGGGGSLDGRRDGRAAVDLGVDAGRDARAQSASGSVITVGGHSYSLNGVFRAATVTTYDGAGVGGYTGAKAKCEAQTGSASAHMCSNEEVLRSAQLGVAIDRGWYSAALDANGPEGDCFGWRIAAAGGSGRIWDPGVETYGPPTGDGCDRSHVILCCDSPM